MLMSKDVGHTFLNVPTVALFQTSCSLTSLRHTCTGNVYGSLNEIQFFGGGGAGGLDWPAIVGS